MKKILALGLCLGMTAGAAFASSTTPQAEKAGYDISNGRTASKANVEAPNSLRAATSIDADLSGSQIVAPVVKTEGSVVDAPMFNTLSGQPVSAEQAAKYEALAREANANWTSTSRNIDCNLAEDILVSAGAYSVGASEKQYFAYTGAGVGLEIATCLPLTTLDTDLWIYDDCTNMTQLFYRDGDSGCGWATYLTSADFTFADGVNYIIAIGGFAGSAGDFEFTVTEGEVVTGPANDNMVDAEPIVVNGACITATTVGATPDCLPPAVQGACYSGYYSATSTCAAADVWYSFMSDGSSLYTVSICGATYDSGLALFDEFGTGIESNDDFCSLQSEITCVLPAGLIYVAVDGYGTSTGDFTLCVTAPDCTPVSCTGTPEVEPNDGPNGDGTVGAITDGETVCGTTFTYTETDTLGNVTNLRDTDWFEILLAADGIITADVAVNEFDAQVLLIADDQATIVASADNNGWCADEQLVTDCLLAGSYYLFVSHNDFTGVDVEAGYGLTASVEACTYQSPCDAAIAITCDQTIAGSTVGLPNLVGNTAGDQLFNVTVPVDATVTFSLCDGLTDYDSYLRLYDICPTDAGAVALATNDDSCGLQSQISTPLVAGSYYLVVEGYSANEGNYSLAMTCDTCEPVVCTGTPEAEPNDGPNGDGTVGTIIDGETICGTVFTWTETDTLGNVTNLRDTDWYQLDLAGDAIVTANLDVEDFDGVLLLVAADQATVIASADAAGFCGDEVMVSDCLLAGTYYVFAAHNDFTGVDVPANYGLSVSLEACTYTSPCDEFVATAITLPYAGTGTNVGAPDVTGTTAGDVGYSFTLTEESTLSWETCLTGTDYDTDSYLFSGDPCNGGTQLIYVDGDSGCTFAAWATGYTYDCGAPLPAGDYTLVISGYSTYEGNFALEVTATPTAEACACDPVVCTGTAEVEPNDGPNGDGTVGSIAEGEVICGNTYTWTETDSLGNVTNFRDTDWYEVLLVGDAELTIDLAVDDFNGILFLVAADLATIVASADAAAYCEAEQLLSGCVAAGSYYIVVAHNDFTGVDAGANYSLSYSSVTCTVPTCDNDTYDTAAVIGSFPYSYAGNTSLCLGDLGPYDIAPAQCQVGTLFSSTGGAADAYFWFELSSATELTFSLCGSSFDTAIGVFADTGVAPTTADIVAVNDDFCGLQSEVVCLLDPGAYYIVVDGYSTAAGDYTLNVTAAALPCDMPANLAIAMVAGSAELSWDAVGTATSYDVYASTDGYGAYTLLGNSATNSYSDAGAQAAGRKFYKVVAVCP